MSVSDKSLPTLKDGVGRPTKRTKKLETELLAAIEAGAPYVLACSSVGICMDTFVNWRRSDVNAANGQNNLELIVIRDLEYAGLRQREGYTYHAEQSVKDVEAQVVPEEVSGYLTRDGSEASGQIISESQAAHLNQSAEEISAKIGKMIRKYRPEFGNGEGGEGSGKEELYNGAGK